MGDVTNDTRRIGACGDDDKAALIDWLYGEIDDESRARVEAHLAACGECRIELDEMRAARAQLATWRVSEPEPGLALVSAGDRGRAGARRYWMPAGLAAAAVLVLAAGAAIANLELQYDGDRLTLRTGWSRAETQEAHVAPTPVPVAAASVTGSPWRDDLVSLERRLRTEFTTVSAPASAPVTGDAELLGRVRALIEESESRQRRELALRVAQVVREFDVQRQTDLVRIQRGLGALEGSSAADRQLLNYLMRVSTPRQ